jgi:HPt (histidine-containing phosphotransfer) domain-containing protein
VTDAPAFDAAANAAVFPDGEAEYRKALSAFRRHDGDADAIGALLEAKDTETALRFVHNLKNAASFIGAERLRRAASRLEKIIGGGEDEIRRALPAGRDETSAVLDSMRRIGA